MAPDSAVDRAALVALASEVFGPSTWAEEVPRRVLSSVELMRFVLRIERRFAVTIPDEELAIENFASMGSVLKMIQRSSEQGTT